MKKFIFVTFQKEGIHSYPEAPDVVAYLRHPHRHMFHFKVTMEVFHDDREVEFIMFKHEMESLYRNESESLFIDQPLQLNNMSCEMLAVNLGKYIEDHYPQRSYRIEVSEDGENGALIESEWK